jgi:hypothetical protein
MLPYLGGHMRKSYNKYLGYNSSLWFFLGKGPSEKSEEVRKN